jgi:hypothetical protein
MVLLVLLLFGPIGLVIFLATDKRSVESTMSRWARSGVIAFGLIGGVAGLVLGLAANPATAWFAVFELGIPSALLGGLLGLASGALASAVRRHAA